MPLSSFLQYKDSAIHYLQYGSGKQILFAFHGFSENAESFLILESSLGEKYTVIAFDIPYHGLTQWKEPAHFTPSDILNIIDLYMNEMTGSRFSVLGFSMGAKFALSITEARAKQIDDLFLLAADGIQTNKIYNVAVYPKWGRTLFKTTIKNPAWMFGLINFLQRIHVLTPWLKKFTKVHMETREKRQRLYDTWISMSEFTTDIEKVRQQIKNNKIRVYLFFGMRDEVIPLKAGQNFCEGLPHCVFTPLDRGHYFIDDKLNAFITDAMKT